MTNSDSTVLDLENLIGLMKQAANDPNFTIVTPYGNFRAYNEKLLKKDEAQVDWIDDKEFGTSVLKVGYLFGAFVNKNALDDNFNVTVYCGLNHIYEKDNIAKEEIELYKNKCEEIIGTACLEIVQASGIGKIFARKDNP